MCGSNLVTKQGLAGKNIDELLKAEVGDNLHIIIQTGGAKTWRSHDISESEAQCYEVKDGGKLSEIPLDGKEYQYVFVVTDIFGNTFTSDIATFEITKSYDELLKNPLPDETFAAKVTNIEPYSTTE